MYEVRFYTKDVPIGMIYVRFYTKKLAIGTTLSLILYEVLSTQQMCLSARCWSLSSEVQINTTGVAYRHDVYNISFEKDSI